MADVGLHTLAELHAAGDPDPHARFQRVDALAFGLSNTGAYVDAKRLITDPERFVIAVATGDDGRSVDAGGSGNFGFHLTLPGGASVPVGGVGDVGVLTSHRRRGILRSMMTWLIEDSAGRGELASTLTASQATIYGRFGYGVAVRQRLVEIPTSAVLRPDAPMADGTLRLHDVAADRDELLEVLPALHSACASNGALSRDRSWWEVVLGEAETYVGGFPNQRALVHLDPAGAPDGYALYRHVERWGDHGSETVLEVREVLGTAPPVELALWSAVLDVDLVVAVRAPLPDRHVLDDALLDVRSMRCRALRDHLWLRPIDVAALLSARTYSADGELVVRVEDPLHEEWGGRFRLRVAGGRATCEREGAVGPTGATPAELSVGLADLGARVLGNGSFRSVARVGRASGDPDVLALADAMFDTDPPPWTDTKF